MSKLFSVCDRMNGYGELHRELCVIPSIREISIVVLEGYSRGCLGREKKEYKCVCVKPWRTWKCFELGKIKFHIEILLFSKIQNIF